MSIDISNLSSLHYSSKYSSACRCDLSSCHHIQHLSQHCSSCGTFSCIICKDIWDLTKVHTEHCCTRHLLVHQQGLLEGSSSPKPPSQSLEITATTLRPDVTLSETFIGSMNLFSLPPLPTLPLDRYTTPLLLPKLSARPKNDILAPANSSPLLFNKLKRTNKKLVKSKSLQDIHRIAILKERAALINKRKLPRPTTDVSVRAPKIVMKNTNSSSSGGGNSTMIPEKNTSIGSESSSYLGKMDVRLRSSHSTNVVPTIQMISFSDVDSNPLLNRDSLPTLFASAQGRRTDYDYYTTDHFHDIHTLQENENSDYPEMLLDYEALTNEVDDDTWHDEVL